MASRTARIAAALLFIACSAPRQQPAATPSQEPVIRVEAPITAHAPRVWAEVDRDVIVTGRVPIIFLNGKGMRLGGRRMVPPRRVLGPDGQPVPPACDETNTSVGRWAAANVDLRCVPMKRPGRYVVEVDLAAEGWGSEVLEIPIRVLSSPPQPRPAPEGWVAVSLSSETPKIDCKDSRAYVPRLHDDQLTIEPYQRSTRSLPQAVRERLGHAGATSGDGIAEAFDGGWMLASDHGEFGGGLQWLPSTGGSPIKLALSTPADDPAPQNVRRIARDADTLYVLQGLSHLGMSEGQFAMVWREQGGFRARVLGHYRSCPADWVHVSDGVWLVATENAVWKTTESGTNELVTRLPDDINLGPSGLVRSSDGVLLLGSTEGVLRMTPLWEDVPRYAAELLVPRDRREPPCVGYNDEVID